MQLKKRLLPVYDAVPKEFIMMIETKNHLDVQEQENVLCKTKVDSEG